MSGTASRIVGAVLTLGLVITGAVFLVSMVQMSRQVDNPTPLMGLVIGGVIFVALWFGPVGRAIGRLLDTRTLPDDQVAQQLDQIEVRVNDLAFDQQRIAELEDRLDFAERLLSQQRQPELPRHPTPV